MSRVTIEAAGAKFETTTENLALSQHIGVIGGNAQAKLRSPVERIERLEMVGRLPPDFALIPAHSWHPDVWSDVARMRTLNGVQHAKGREMHLCPLQFDVVERCIAQRSMPGELVFDPFGGLMTVPYCALKLGRRGAAVELSPGYFRDGCAHVAAMAREMATPGLFAALDAEAASAAEVAA